MRAPLILIACAIPLQAATYYITVAGLGGAPEYEERFSGWAKDIDKSLHGLADARIETLYGSAATKAKFQSVMSQFARDANSGDALVVMLIGHGSFDGVDYKINLPGPDLSAAELAALIDRVPAKRQLVVNMTSSSGAARSALEKPNRLIVTATRSGAEKNATVFAQYWAEALRDPAADTDKDETISALEAFRYAQGKTAKFYEAEKRLATEHAILENIGEGVADPPDEPSAGQMAARVPLLMTGAAQRAASDPAKKAQFAHKEELEDRIDRLKRRKGGMPAEQYKKQIADLLLELAKTQAELNQ